MQPEHIGDKDGQNLEIAPLLPVGAEIAAVRRDFLMTARRMAASAASAAAAASATFPAGAPDVATAAVCTPSAKTQVTSATAANTDMLVPPESLLKSSISRLDARVKALENQSARGDRRTAELAGLTQALTEEQRSLLLRLDRLEELFRNARGARDCRVEIAADVANSSTGNETIERLERVEQELRVASTNLSLVMNLVDESEHRQQERVRRFEAQLEEHLKATPCREALRENKAEANVKDDGISDLTAMAAKIHIDFSKRADKGQENKDPRFGVQTLEAHDEAIRELQSRLSEAIYHLAPRTEIVEAKLKELTDAAQNPKGQHDDKVEAKIQCLADALEEAETMLKKAQDDQSLALADVRKQVEELVHIRPKPEVVENAEAGLLNRFEDLQKRVQDMSGIYSNCQRLTTERLDAQEAFLKTFQQSITELRYQLTEHSPSDYDCQPAIAEMQKRLEEQSAGISDLRCQVLTVASSRCAEEPPAAPHEDISVTELTALKAAITNQADAIAEMKEKIDSSDGTGVLGSATSLLLQAHSQHISELQEYVADLHCRKDSGRAFEASGHVNSQGHETDLHATVRTIRQQFDELRLQVQNCMEESLEEVKQKGPELERRLDLISTDSSEHSQTIEEHEVRLGLLGARQEAGDQKFQSCMDRIEQLQGLCRLRSASTSNEEMLERVTESDVQSISERLDLTMDAVTELAEKVQSLHDAPFVPIWPSLDTSLNMGE